MANIHEAQRYLDVTYGSDLFMASHSVYTWAGGRVNRRVKDGGLDIFDIHGGFLFHVENMPKLKAYMEDWRGEK